MSPFAVGQKHNFNHSSNSFTIFLNWSMEYEREEPILVKRQSAHFEQRVWSRLGKLGESKVSNKWPSPSALVELHYLLQMSPSSSPLPAGQKNVHKPENVNNSGVKFVSHVIKCTRKKSMCWQSGKVQCSTVVLLGTLLKAIGSRISASLASLHATPLTRRQNTSFFP